MPIVQANTMIRAAVQRTWDYVSDPANLPVWSPAIPSVSDIRGGPGEGTTFKYQLHLLGITGPGTARVVRWEPGQRMAIRFTGQYGTTLLDVQVARRGPGARVSASLEWTEPGSILVRIADRAVLQEQFFRHLDLALRNLKALVENLEFLAARGEA